MTDAMPLGYGIQIGANVRQGEIHGNIVYGDNTKMGMPFALEDGDGDFANDQIGVDRLSVHDNFSNGYKTQKLHIENVLVKGAVGTRRNVNDLRIFNNSGFTPETVNLLSQSNNNNAAWALPAGMGGNDIKAELRLAGINVT